MTPEIVADRPDLLGEGPLWHAGEQALYRVDYLRGELLRFDPATGRDETIYGGPKVSGFTLQADGALLLLAEGARVLRWKDGVATVLVDGFPGSAGMHFNDCVADPRGRVFTGTVPDDPDHYAAGVGRLVRIDRDAGVIPLVEGIGISNGLAFSPAADRLYFTDTLSCRIDVFDYEADAGTLSNRRLFVDLASGPGRPDGLAVDREGHVWSARWDGSAVYRYAPDGREVGRIEFAAKKITSVAFGGSALAELYVTSAGGDDRANEGAAAGALFRLASGTQGCPRAFSRIGI
ncbi:MAG: SMP-30/gluconolactonase/LRE family protein [Deltaproteobacteria bacterium]|nr:SMP-30/gluconolactonase/LRE family protein [Deltaproteobacteria bacterium]